MISSFTFFYCHLKNSNKIKNLKVKWSVIPDSSNWSSNYFEAEFQGKVLYFNGRMVIWILSGCWTLTQTLSWIASFPTSAGLIFWWVILSCGGVLCPVRCLAATLVSTHEIPIASPLSPAWQKYLSTQPNVSRGKNLPQLKIITFVKGKTHLLDISIPFKR